VGKYLNGKNLPSVRVIAKMSEILGVPVPELLWVTYESPEDDPKTQEFRVWWDALGAWLCNFPMSERVFLRDEIEKLVGFYKYLKDQEPEKYLKSVSQKPSSPEKT